MAEQDPQMNRRRESHAGITASFQRGTVAAAAYIVVVLLVALFLAIAWWHADLRLGQAEFSKSPRTWTPTLGVTAVCCAAFAAMTMAPWYPPIGIWVYIALAYGFPRYRSAHVFLLHTHMLEWISALGILGWVVWMVRNGRRPRQNVDVLSWLLIALLVWIAVATAASVASTDGWQPALKHHPVRFLSVLAMFALAREFLCEHRELLLLGLVFAASLCVRALLYPDMIKGDGDISALAVEAIPVVLLAAGLARSWPVKGAMMVLPGYLLWVLVQTQNRGAAVALLAVLIVSWSLSPRKWLSAAVGLPPLVLGSIWFVNSSYWQRFADIWEGGPALGSVLGRFDLWRAAWQMFLDRPVFGVGPGEYYAHVGTYDPRQAMYGPHNHVMGLLSEAGVPGVLLYFAFFLTALGVAWLSVRRCESSVTRFVQRRLASAVVACLVSGCFIARYTEPLGFVFAGAIAALSVKCLADDCRTGRTHLTLP